MHHSYTLLWKGIKVMNVERTLHEKVHLYSYTYHMLGQPIVYICHVYELRQSKKKPPPEKTLNILVS